MAVRVQNLSMKTLGQNPIHSMPHLTGNYSPWWNHNEQQLSQNLSLRVEPQDGHGITSSVHQLQDNCSSSTHSSSQSLLDMSNMSKAHSEDPCVSSESADLGKTQSFQKHVEVQMSATFSVSNAELPVNMLMEMSQTAAPIPYGYVDPYFSGLLSAYGPPAIIQPQMVGIAPGRIPLPPDVAQDSPMYVNAKQYHGILRRRQMRAKLEAQNKLIKNRKPYLHQSRHLHAMNRVRGSGGRFLSMKKEPHSDPTPTSPCQSLSASVYSHKNQSSAGVEVHYPEADEHNASDTTNSAVTSHTNGNFIFHQPADNRSSTVSSRGFVGYESQHCGPEYR